LECEAQKSEFGHLRRNSSQGLYSTAIGTDDDNDGGGDYNDDDGDNDGDKNNGDDVKRKRASSDISGEMYFKEVTRPLLALYMCTCMYMYVFV
jgi:hypothetical protein